MRVDRVLSWLLGLSFLIANLAPPARAMEGPGGGETNPFAALRAEASANLFTGAAAVSVPILVPPGRRQTTPELALRYSSHGGLSFVGVGWSLPLGVLSRAVEHGTPACDGPDPEDFRLTLASSSNALVREGADRFLLEFDEGFAEAIPDRAANRWTVRTREGLAYTFGGSEASRVHSGADRFFDEAGCALTTAWSVTRLEDPNGNAIEIDWEKSGNTPLPREIRYGGNEPASIPHPFRIRFESEDLASLGRPILRTLASGVDQRLLRRIRTILVEARSTRAGAFEEIRRYELEYDDSSDTADFLLAAVAATDLPERRFGYATATPTIVDDLSQSVPDPETLGASLSFGGILALMDLNGDALLDRLCVDGHGDWHAAYGEKGEVQFTGYSSCGGAGNWSVPSIAGVALDRISKVVNGQDVYLTLDLDGDGLPDLVRRPPQSGSIHVYRGGCTSAWDCGFSTQPEVWNNPYPAADRTLRRTSAGSRGLQTLRDLVDLNGDGRPDLVAALANGDWQVFLNTGSGFATTPRIHAGIDPLLAYSPNDNQNAEEERQLIDVNDDGLVDWVRGVRHASPLSASDRIPELYFGVGPQGETTGPFPLAGGPYLCPSTVLGQSASLCAGANALPAGWAIVGAATVRLNTGSGFSAPIATPAPFWQDGDETANRLRASWTATGSRETHTYRDFVDVNGDGRVDWVSTGYPYDGSASWYVLFNQGDGRFGGGLALLAPASESALGLSLGRVRPAATLANVEPYLGRTFQHTSPDDRVDRQMMVLDVDADGLAEQVRSFGIGGSDRWAVTRLRFTDADGLPTRPRLLTRIDDGVGGRTELRYAPSSLFVPSPDVAPRLPFVTWLVTGVRRTDGLCDAEPSDWFTLAGNPCLAAGHELVQRIEYEDGAYDGLARSFLGFARARVFDGPAGIGSLRELAFHQTPALKGKLVSETVYAGGVDRLSRTTYDWRTRADGPRTQVYLQEQRVEENVLYPQFGAGPGDAQCVVHRNSILRSNGSPDPAARIHSACSMACAGAGDSDALCGPTPVGKKQIDTVWAEPVPGVSHPVWDRPAEIVTRHVDGSGALGTVARVRHLYDGLVQGLVDRGRLMSEWSAISESPVAWAFKSFEYDGGVSEGPGNVTAVFVPVTGATRVPSRVAFDAEFALHPVRESAWVSNAGASAERRIESVWDLRVGKKSETVGLQGRGAGDVAGTVWDSLGRPVCEFAPGTACGAASGFGATAEYRHVYGTPGAADPIERLSSVEVRRREPNAPQGFLTTRSYFDALGRERLTTNEQNVVDPPAPDGRPTLETVVARQLAYGPNGKPVRSFAPYVAPAAGLDLAPPSGVAAAQTSYVLNGNAAGRLDPAGRVFETTGFDGSRAQTYVFGRIVRRVDGIGAGASGGDHTVERLDEHGRIRERRSLAGASQLLAQWNGEYDGRDRLVAEAYGGSTSTRITRRFDLLGRAVETDDPDAGLWKVAYDEAGNEIFRDDPEPGQGIQSCYDGLDRVVLQCARASDVPDPGLCAAAQPDCTIAYRFRYDEATPLLGTANHGLGRLTTAEGPDGRQRSVYDVRGRVVLALDEIQGEAAATRYAYRADLDRLEGMTYPDGERVRYGYDASGQPAWLSQVDAAGSWLAYYVRRIVYDLRGRPLAIERGNLTTDRFEYHGAAEGFALARISTRSEGAKVFDPRTVYAELAYRDYDAKGRLVRVDDLRDGVGALSMSAGYGYDAAGRLTSVTGPSPESFAYDAIGNLTALGGQAFSRSSAAASILGPHQFDRLGNPASLHWTLAFDGNGRRTAKQRSDGAFVQTARYDAFGALRTLVTNGVTTSYGHAHDGRRLVETRNGSTRRFFGRHAERVNGTLFKYYYLGDRLIATRSEEPAASGASGAPGTSAATAANRFVATAPVRLAGIAVGAVLLLVPFGRSRRALGLRVARSGALGSSLLVLVASLPVVVPALGCLAQANIRHYHLNHLGSPIAITGPGGTLERQYRYSAYGEVRRFDAAGQPAAPDASSRREFTGYDGDALSGLQYAGSRYYDPATASFLTPDPADEHASPYAYVGWDPINAVDPNGAELSLVAAVLLAISAALVVASAIVAGVQSGSASVGFQALGIGIAGLAAGYVVGLAAPAAAAASLISETSAAAINASLSVASIGVSIYGLSAAEDPGMLVLAGAGLALSLAGAAYSLGSLARPRAGVGGLPVGGNSRGASGWPDPPGLVRTRSMSPQLAQRLALEAQRRMIQLAQYTALVKVKAGIAEIRAAFAGRTGIDVYAEVLIEGPRIPHPTRVFAQHLLPNRVEVSPVLTPTGRGPTPTLMAPVPWDRFRLHDFVPVLRNGVAVPAH